MSHINVYPAWEAPSTPPLSPRDVEKPVPAAAAVAASASSPAAVMRELTALAVSKKTPPKAAEAAWLGQSLLLSAAHLLELEGVHSALSADFDAKMDAWESAIYVSAPDEVKAARTAALETLGPLREAVSALDIARAAWAALDALRSGSAANTEEFDVEAWQEEAVKAGRVAIDTTGTPGPAEQAQLPMMESLINILSGMATSTAPEAPEQAPLQQLGPLSFHPVTTGAPVHHMPAQMILGGAQPAPVLLRSQPMTSQPIFGGISLLEEQRRTSPPRRGPSPTFHGMAGDELGMLTPIAEDNGPIPTAEGLDFQMVLAVAATTGVPVWTSEDPMYGLSPMLRQQLEAMQHSGGGYSSDRRSSGAEGEALEYADVLCAMGRERGEGGGRLRGRGRAARRDSSSREGGATPTTGSDALTAAGTSTEGDFLEDPETQTRRERLEAAVAPFFNGAAAVATVLPVASISGVTQHKRTGKYEAHVWAGKKQTYLGSFYSQEAAARAHDIAALGARPGPRVSEARLNFSAADYSAIRPLLDQLDLKRVAGVLKKISRSQPGSGRGSVASGRGGAVIGQKRGRPGGSPGSQAETQGLMKRKGPSERSPVA